MATPRHLVPTPMAAQPQREEKVAYATILLADFRVGRILSAERLEARKPMYKLVIDVGCRRPEARTVISAISGVETPEQSLPGMLVVVGCFIRPKTILGHISDGLLLTAYADPERKTGSIPVPAPQGVP